MAELIRMPRMSDTMTEALIVAWHKQVGDKVKPGDVLAEVETDKATMELESYNEGTLLYIGVDKGKAVKVDGVLAIVGKEGEDYKPLLEKANKETPAAATSKEMPAGTAAKEQAPAPTPAPATSEIKSPASATAVAEKKEPLPEGAKVIRMPLLSDTMTEGKIISWNKKVGDKVKSDDVLAEVETDKATMEVVGYEEGTLLYVGVEAGKAAKINEIIAIVGKPGTDVSAYVSSEKSSSDEKAPASPAPQNIQQAATAQSSAAAIPAPAQGNGNGRIKASPLAKKLAREKGIEISNISGTGDGGRITKKDVDQYKPGAVQAGAKIAPIAFQPLAGEGHTDIPLSQMRRIIARRLVESKFSAPHFYLTMEIDMDNAITARDTLNEASPVKISFNDFIIKACALALRRHPAVNSSWMGEFIRQNHHIHIGSAVAVEEGLIVPVIRFADQKSLSQIAAEAKSLYAKAKERKLQPEEFTGNTFTISNLGMMDIEEFTAIINPPDSCILAVGKIKEVVVKKHDVFEASKRMKVTLSCDHRSVDGAVGASFLQTLKLFLENPVTMLV